MLRKVACLTLLAVFALDARTGNADEAKVTHSPIGREYLRLLGKNAGPSLAPGTGQIGALVAVPPGTTAEALGLEPVATGIGRLRASADRIDSWAAAHPGLRLEIAPPVRPLMDKAAVAVFATHARALRGVTGRGVMVGVADTGLDITSPEMVDANGKSRVAWFLDLSLRPGDKQTVLEDRFGIKDASGKVTNGRVFDKAELDDLLADIASEKCVEGAGKKCAPSDEVGHGTHVTGIAAGSGVSSRYGGIAPEADIVFVRLTHSAGGGIDNDDLLRAVRFMFDRATAESRPMVVNLSLGSDFGPHDGSFLWEKAIADEVGPAHPGHIVVAAAGNSGSIVETPIHQSVRVTPGAIMRVPIRTGGALRGQVQIWITPRRGADLKIGLDGPDGEWIAPVTRGGQRGKNTAEYNAGVLYGPGEESSIPEGSNGAVIVWDGKWPKGTYYVTLEGSGMAELYLQGNGDAGLGSANAALFEHGVREGTINLPATHPSILAVGCTVNRVKWTSQAGIENSYFVPQLDVEGGLPIKKAVTTQLDLDARRSLVEGEVCWFSSTGPTPTGAPKPEISAPGAFVISALSRNALPGTPYSVFSSSSCAKDANGVRESQCYQVDDRHGIALGTSMSSPVVAGVIALLLQQDPTLTQDQVLALLQAGAHRFRASTLFDDVGGPGEVDAMGSLEALDQMRGQDSTAYLPSFARSWVTLSSDYVPADGSTPITAIIELRSEDGLHRSDFFDSTRLTPTLLVDGKPVAAPNLVRRGPGVWFFVWNPPAGLGGGRATFGAKFDGQPIVQSRSLPIGPDRWTALYPSYAKGSSCAMSPDVSSASASASASPLTSWLPLLAALLLRARRRRS